MTSWLVPCLEQILFGFLTSRAGDIFILSSPRSVQQACFRFTMSCSGGSLVYTPTVLRYLLNR